MKISNIRKTYGKSLVLEDISLDVLDKEFFVILGSSGSGKSTLLKIIAGIEERDAGEILMGEGSALEKRIGYIFQETLLFPHMNVKQNICYSLTVAKKPKNDVEEIYKKLVKALEIEGLDKNMPHMLSGGQKQRVSIARSLANSPKILLMDEPFSSLDKNLRMKMGQFMKEIQKEFHLTIIFVTHDIEEAIYLGERIAVLSQGKILEVNEGSQLYYNPKYEETARFMGEYNKIAGKLINGEFHCKYGIFSAPNLSPVGEEIYVRPEKIQIIKELDGEFKIEEIISQPKQYIIKLKNEDMILRKYIIGDLKEGDSVRVHMEFI